MSKSNMLGLLMLAVAFSANSQNNDDLTAYIGGCYHSALQVTGFTSFEIQEKGEDDVPMLYLGMLERAETVINTLNETYSEKYLNNALQIGTRYSALMDFYQLKSNEKVTKDDFAYALSAKAKFDFLCGEAKL
ncbi:hypothetical protein ACPV5O_11440 [Vibrio maritimus]|uniref:hypothetical protein n=1 Tax=Vibrio maritimus TaxID=990268 RepID=UPI004067A4FE